MVNENKAQRVNIIFPDMMTVSREIIRTPSVIISAVKPFTAIPSKKGASGKNLFEIHTWNESSIPKTKNTATVFLTNFNRSATLRDEIQLNDEEVFK